jgi:hypothetical protein
LAQQGIVKIYVPEIVRREWLSHFEEELTGALKSLRDAERRVATHPLINNISASYKLSNHDAELKVTDDNTDTLCKAVTDKVDKLLQEIRAEVIPIDKKHGQDVMDSYFVGHPPFGKARNKDDIPDAFIYETAKDLSREVGMVHFVVADAALGTACKKIKNSKVHKSIYELLKSNEIEEARRDIKLEMYWSNWLAAYKPKLPDLSSILVSKLESQVVDALAYKYVEHSLIPDDNQEANIVGVYEPSDVEIDWNSMDDLGGGWFSVPVSFQIEVEAEFYIYRSDAYHAPDGVWVIYDDPEEHHYFEAGGTLDIEVHAVVSVRIAEDMIMNNGFGDLDEIRIEKIETMEVIEQSDGSIFQKRQ